MNRPHRPALAVLALISLSVSAWWFFSRSDGEGNRRFEDAETEVELSNLSGARLALFRAGTVPGAMTEIQIPERPSFWLTPGRYCLRAEEQGTVLWYPVPLTGYRSGPDEEGRFRVTVRKPPPEVPPPAPGGNSGYVHIPAGTFLLGDRRNPREPHQIWLPAYFIARFEVTNAQFREFLSDPEGYASESHWTEVGLQWRLSGSTAATATLRAGDRSYARFGLDDHPVVWVTWYEASAYCAWLTARKGGGRWLFVLPTEAEWEKAARGPESLEYALGMTLSDREADDYNWRRNPSSDTSLVGVSASFERYRPNTYGAYHLTGNALEWTRSLYLPYNRDSPYHDGPRNAAGSPGRRVARGGSWYSASNAYLLNAYRDAFQPEHSSQELGFRVVARLLP